MKNWRLNGVVFNDLE